MTTTYTNSTKREYDTDRAGEKGWNTKQKSRVNEDKQQRTNQNRQRQTTEDVEKTARERTDTMSESDLSWTSESDGDEWHDASDSDWESEWRCGVESDSTTDEEDGRKNGCRLVSNRSGRKVTRRAQEDAQRTQERAEAASLSTSTST